MKEIKMRRYQNLLTVSGLGVIIFGLWTVLKTILLLFLQEDMVDDLPDGLFYRVLFFTLIGGVLLIDFLIRLFVGLSARAEGFGKKKGYGYIVVAILIAIASLASLVLIFFDTADRSILELIVSFIVEATSMIATVELGIRLNPDEAAAIIHHMGAFGLSGRALDEFDAALDAFPGPIIATHTADWLASRLDESGDWSDMRSEVPNV